MKISVADLEIDIDISGRNNIEINGRPASPREARDALLKAIEAGYFPRLDGKSVRVELSPSQRAAIAAAVERGATVSRVYAALRRRGFGFAVTAAAYAAAVRRHGPPYNQEWAVEPDEHLLGAIIGAE